MTIYSSNLANLNISTTDETISLTLSPGQVYEKDYDVDLHPTQDVENKAIRIISDVEVQVLMYKTDNWDEFNDVYLVPNHIRESNTYFTTTHPGRTGHCSDSFVKQFYVVSSFYDDTSIQVLQQDGTTYDLDLPTFGTFAQSTKDGDEHLAMGTKIISNKPINIISGILCARNPGGGGNFYGTYVTSLPSAGSLGHQYIVPNIIHLYIDNSGYSVAVVATEDGTVVDSNGDLATLDQGETALFEYPYIDGSVAVNCSSNCFVTQYSKFIFSDSYRFGLFSQNVLSEDDFTTSSNFTTLDVHPIWYISIVLEGESPGNNLRLNGNSLGYLDWNPINGYSTAAVAIPSGVYELDSTDGRPYAAYVYYSENYAAGGAGFSIPMQSSGVIPSSTAPTTTASTTTSTAPTAASTTSAMPSTASTGTSTNPTSPTTPSPSVNATLPQLTARVNGSASTEDGEDISLICMMVSI